jgi:4-hydroxy-3-methylbut-2-en-1-yl diphosphate synthase IspG/GcpE
LLRHFDRIEGLIRIGVNAGSPERPLLEKYGYPAPEAMVESARHHIRILPAFFTPRKEHLPIL